MTTDKVLKAYKEEIDYFYGQISNHDHHGSMCNCSEWYDELAETIGRRDEYLAEEYGDEDCIEDKFPRLTTNEVL
jgi:hypothetical protein